jgi:hypothetical protein
MEGMTARGSSGLVIQGLERVIVPGEGGVHWISQSCRPNQLPFGHSHSIGIQIGLVGALGVLRSTALALAPVQNFVRNMSK